MAPKYSTASLDHLVEAIRELVDSPREGTVHVNTNPSGQFVPARTDQPSWCPDGTYAFKVEVVFDGKEAGFFLISAEMNINMAAELVRRLVEAGVPAARAGRDRPENVRVVVDNSLTSGPPRGDAYLTGPDWF